MSPQVRSFGDSYIGRRSNNEDTLGKREPKDPTLRSGRGCLYVVCDGLGGHAAGEIARRIAVEIVLAEYYTNGLEPAAGLVAAIQRANQQIHLNAGNSLELEGMGCTVVTCVILENRAVIAHVGDSRAYHCHDSTLRLLTVDHTAISDDLSVEPGEVPGHRQHALSRALGVKPQVEISVTGCPWQPADRFLLCTDGLSDSVSESELLEALALNSPREATSQLMRRAESNSARDNSSAVVIFVEG